MSSIVLVGGFFGDEGKGKIISYLAIKDNPEIIVRGGAGPNAGHTVMDNDRTYKIRMLPSGFLNRNARIMIGPGVVINPDILQKEIQECGTSGRTFVDRHCGIIEQSHLECDRRGDIKNKIGSTGSGTGPANADRAMRTLMLAGDVKELLPITTDVAEEIHTTLAAGHDVLIEGTQGTFLSLWHGTYPFVTSKDVTASGICADVGIGPTKVDEVIVVFKSYVTRVGTGPLANELSAGETQNRGWTEVGTVTGRQRRAAEFDYSMARRAVMLNGATQVCITKLDILFPSCRSMISFESLPDDAKAFIQKIEDELGVPVTIIGTGPRVNDIIDRRQHGHN